MKTQLDTVQISLVLDQIISSHRYWDSDKMEEMAKEAFAIAIYSTSRYPEDGFKDEIFMMIPCDVALAEKILQILGNDSFYYVKMSR
jgi:hypothetical protein